MTADNEIILTRIFDTLHDSRPIYQSTERPGNMSKSWKPRSQRAGDFRNVEPMQYWEYVPFRLRRVIKPSANI